MKNKFFTPNAFIDRLETHIGLDEEITIHYFREEKIAKMYLYSTFYAKTKIDLEQLLPYKNQITLIIKKPFKWEFSNKSIIVFTVQLYFFVVYLVHKVEG